MNSPTWYHSKTLVSSRSDDQPLVFEVARGSPVLEHHEAKLAELCANPDTSDQEAEQCVLEYLQGGYFDGDTLQQEDDECDLNNPSEDCMLDNVLDLWADDVLPPTSSSSTSETTSSPSDTTESSSTTPKPWSSRASPSGTFVRDPITGEMRNIES